ncbi:MAG: FAD-dependent oxidoreductase [Sneathiellaceae bacterium]
MTGTPRLTRRGFLRALGAIGGAAAVYDAAGILGLLKVRSAQAKMPLYEPGRGAGRKVIVVGAGMAGLTAAWHLARNGFAVEILEAGDRIGGRNLTLRNGDRFAEAGGPEQTCRLVQNEYSDGTPVEVPTYINAGPGRIGQHSAIVQDYCRAFGVALEPYIFSGENNLLQSDAAFGGAPMPFRRVRNGYRSGIAGILEGMVKTGELDKPLSALDRERFLRALRAFGGVDTAGFEKALGMAGHDQVLIDVPRNGFTMDPGAFLQAGTPMQDLALEQIVASGFWDSGLWSGLEYRWQGVMLEPRGGMDMIWRRMIARPLPDGRTLADMVRLRSPVAGIWNAPDGVTMATADGTRRTADFCICTATPKVIAGLEGNLSPRLKAACDKVQYIPSVRMAAQMRSRFWEEIPDSTLRIFGGISFTDAVTSQVWYPSAEFQTRRGVLVTGYNFFDKAVALADMSLEQRLEAALVQGEKFHPGRFRSNYIEGSAVSVAWHRMPWQHGAAVDEPSYTDPSLYRTLVEGFPDGRVYGAGDWLSYLPGWMDGAFETAEIVVSQIAERVRTP